jgi:hypothetical protein
MLPEPLAVVRMLVEIFDGLRIPYLIGGSIASSTHGFARSTNDVDFVVDLQSEQISALVAALQPAFYLEEEMISEAVMRRDSFSILHLSTMVKADIFLRQSDAWAAEEFARRQREVLGSGKEAYLAYLASAEDMILQKLVWFRLGGGVAERQWKDVLGMLKVQSPSLDYAYLHRWALERNVADLLTEALIEAGLISRSESE